MTKYTIPFFIAGCVFGGLVGFYHAPTSLPFWLLMGAASLWMGLGKLDTETHHA